MTRNYEWVDYVFIQSTAWFLNHDIMIITTTSTEQSPYITISGNLANKNVPCGGFPLIIGTMSNIHYQSMLPISRQKTRKQVNPHLPNNSITLEMNSEKHERIEEMNDIPKVSKGIQS